MNFSKLYDAFVDLMDQIFYPGYVNDMTSEQFKFEFEKFQESYAWFEKLPEMAASFFSIVPVRIVFFLFS